MKFRPLHDRVVVQRVDAEEKTKGGIIIPDTAKEKPQEGEVIAVGPGGRDESGKLVPLDVKVGDRILFGKWSGTEVKIDGEELLIMKESDIMGMLEGRAAKPAAQRPRESRARPQEGVISNFRTVLNHLDRERTIMAAKDVKFSQRRPREDASRRRHPRQRGEGDAGSKGPQRRASRSPTARRASPRTA